MTHTVYITVYPDTGDAFGMKFYVPVERDVEEYVEEMLSRIFNPKFSFCDWEFD